jgi:hypothetical protein
MYHQVGLHALSNPQISKLLSGKPVRVRHGTHHKASLSTEHVKKLHRASMKGKAVTLQLDPYCCQMNEHMRGTGFFDTLKSIAKVVAPVARQIATPIARTALSSYSPLGQIVGNTAIDLANQQAEAHGYGLKKRAGRPRKYVHHDKRIENGRIVEPVMLGQPLHGAGFFDSLKSIAKPVSKTLRPVATNFLQQQLAKSGNPLLQAVGNVGLDLANQTAEAHGYGLRKKKAGRPRKKGRALYPAGSHGGELYC